ncbi:MAG: type II secretion system F family protein [Defluviitaleaceae bacterium]|nr:type II secretion system F family protein [Defluviitaleaceae bacterium]
MPISPHYQRPQKTNTGLKPISIWHRDIGSLLKPGYHQKATFRELSVFARKLSFLLGAGVPIKAALSIVSEQLPGRCLRRLVPSLAAKVEQGESFSHSIRGTGAFSDFFCGFVSIGEATATLPQVMEQLADFYDDWAQTRDELIAALLYPIIVSIMMLGVIILAVTFVLPGYSRIFAATDTPLPALTRGLLMASEFLTTNAIFVAICFLFALIVLALFYKSTYGREATAVVELRIPVMRLGINFRLTQSLHLLLTAGLPVSQALPLVEGVMSNVRVRRDIIKISAQMGVGKPFWETLNKAPYIDPLLIGFAKVGEETGRMTQTMEKCQAYYSQAYKQAVRRLNKLVEPIITLVLGVGLGVIMLAVILPTFELATIM